MSRSQVNKNRKRRASHKESMKRLQQLTALAEKLERENAELRAKYEADTQTKENPTP